MHFTLTDYIFAGVGGLLGFYVLYLMFTMDEKKDEF
jgi:hypothetical protein